MNPKDFNWLDEPCNVSTGEKQRLEALRDAWYGKANVGDGTEVVLREDLDPWQRFAHDIVMDARHSKKDPLRLMVTGVAGTGKSRTVRSFGGEGGDRGRGRRLLGPEWTWRQVPGVGCAREGVRSRRLMRRCGIAVCLLLRRGAPRFS